MHDALASRKHTLLLVFMVLGEALQAFATTTSRGLFFDVFLSLLLAVVFFVVFEGPKSRTLGMALGGLGLVCNWLHYVLSGLALFVSLLAHQGFMWAFFTFAAVVILRGIFGKRAVDADAVVGAVCGYVLAGVAFGALYTLVDLLHPGAFAIGSAIAPQLQNWHGRRFLLGYFSLVTLTSMGYGEITPISPVAVTLTWVEAVFGQFYLAVVVAQLVGMRMSPVSGGTPAGKGNQV